jgi:hypothetical protein
VKPLLDLGGVGGLKEQCQRLDEIRAGFFQAVALAGDIEFDDGCQRRDGGIV